MKKPGLWGGKGASALTFLGIAVLSTVASAASLTARSVVCTDWNFCQGDFLPVPVTSTTTVQADGVVAPGSTFSGTATATADFLSLKLHVDVGLTNYPSDAFISDPNDPDAAIASAGSATALSTDTFTFQPSDPQIDNGFLHMIFNVDRIVSNNLPPDIAFVADTGLSVFETANPFNRSFSVFNSSGTTTEELIIPIALGIPIELRTALAHDLQLGQAVLIRTNGDVSSLVDFSNTVTLESILVTDAEGNPIPGISMSAESGTLYPVSPLNAVPIPPAVWLFVSGLLGLMGIARTRKAA